jgi:hypothetical protein
MNKTSLRTEPDGVEERSTCPCCGRAAIEGSGFLLSPDRDLASYEYRWIEGHDPEFFLAIVPFDAEERLIGLAAVSCTKTSDQLVYHVLDAEDSPWAETDVLRPFLGRDSILRDGAIPNFFALVDSIVAAEARLYNRILGT